MWNSVITAVITKILKMIVGWIIDQIDSGVEKKKINEEVDSAKESNNTAVLENMLS